jgi:hypothetical protein
MSIDRRMIIRGLDIRLLLDTTLLRTFGCCYHLNGRRRYTAFTFVACYFLLQLKLLAREIPNGTNGILDGASAFQCTKDPEGTGLDRFLAEGISASVEVGI